MKNIVEEEKIEKEEQISKDVAADTTEVFFTYDVPQSAICYVTHFANILDYASAWGSVTWELRRNGIPIHPFPIKDQYGLAMEPRPIRPIEFVGGDKLEMVIISTFSTTVGVGFSMFYEIGRPRR